MKRNHGVSLLIVAASILFSTCSNDGTGPATPDSDGVFGALAAMGVQSVSGMQGQSITIPDPGTIDDANGVSLKAMGIELVLGTVAVQGLPSDSGANAPPVVPVITQVMAWEAGNSPNEIVRALISGALRLSQDVHPIVPGTTVTVGQPGEVSALGSYLSYSEGTELADWLAMEGFFTLDNAVFDGETFDCSRTRPDGIRVTCTMTLGRMTGSFGFDAQRRVRTPGDSIATFDPTDRYVQPTTSFDLPALHIEVSPAAN